MDDRTRLDGLPSLGSQTRPDDATVAMRGAAVDEPSLAEPARDTHIGRYVVIGEVGRGAMGRVLRAYDPKLQREVALKQVYEGRLGKEGLLRLMAEARAMAKLSHPHVVGVYDVEEQPDGGIVLAMEYVAGISLRQWIGAQPREWDEVVRQFQQAGRGLAAAHAAGLLHRDFKPANVLVGEDGGIKVTDFGLAKMLADAPSVSISSHGAEESLGDDLTQAGTVMGTPRYMAPEQHFGGDLSAATDQYAFCVALWEALCERPPFLGKSGYKELADEKLKGPPAWPNPRVPGPISAAIAKGLAAEPSQRWPSMDALLDALAWDPAVRRRRVLLGVGTVAAVLLAGTGWRAWSTAMEARCSGAREQLEAAWGSSRRAEVEAAMRGVKASFAAGVWERTAGQLDRYADDWAAAHTEACAATTIRGEQSAELMDLRMACLQRARHDLQAVTTQLADADADVLSKAHRLTDGLPALDRCADVEALRAAAEPPRPEEREAVEAVQAQLAELRAQLQAGRYSAAEASLETILAATASLEYGPLQSEVAYAEARVREELGDYPAAEAALRRALESAARWNQRETMAAAATQLVWVIGSRQERTAEGLQYRELARGLVQDDPAMLGGLLHNLATVLDTAGSLEEAEALERQALELRTQALGPDDPEVASTLNNLANTVGDRGRPLEAERLYRRALEIWERKFGPEHPEVAMARHNVALALYDQGRYAESETELRRSLELWEAALGPDHPEIARVLGSLGLTLSALGRFDEAEVAFRRGLAIREATLGPDHSAVGMSLSNLGTNFAMQGRYPEAAEYLRRALAIQERRLGASHHEVGRALINLGIVLTYANELDEAERSIRQGMATLEASVGPRHPAVATGRANLGSIYQVREQYDRAEAELRAALEAMEAEMGPDHPELAVTRHNLGTVLQEQQRYEEAEVEHRRALAVWEPSLDPEHPYLASVWQKLGEIELQRGHPEQALALGERAWVRRQHDDTPREYLAETAFLIARALVESNGDRARARELAERAVTAFGEAGPLYVRRITDVQQWLDAHPR